MRGERERHGESIYPDEYCCLLFFSSPFLLILLDIWFLLLIPKCTFIDKIWLPVGDRRHRSMKSMDSTYPYSGDDQFSLRCIPVRRFFKIHTVYCSRIVPNRGRYYCSSDTSPGSCLMLLRCESSDNCV